MVQFPFQRLLLVLDLTGPPSLQVSTPPLKPCGGKGVFQLKNCESFQPFSRNHLAKIWPFRSQIVGSSSI